MARRRRRAKGRKNGIGRDSKGRFLKTEKRKRRRGGRGRRRRRGHGRKRRSTRRRQMVQFMKCNKRGK